MQKKIVYVGVGCIIIILVYYLTILNNIGIYQIKPEHASSANANLWRIANSTIEVTEKTLRSGAVIFTYTNINECIALLQQKYPDLSDYDLAIFLRYFTGQSTDNLPEKEILNILQYDNISLSSAYFQIKYNGAVQEISRQDAFTASADSLIKITTGLSLIQTDDEMNYYTIWTSADWPAGNPHNQENTLVLSNNATFNSEYEEQGIVQSAYTCPDCGQTTYKTRNVNSQNTADADLYLEYNSFAPFLRFKSLKTKCANCPAHYIPQAASCHAYLECGIIAADNVQIQAGYACQKAGGNINVTAAYPLSDDYTFTSQSGKPVICIAPALKFN